MANGLAPPREKTGAVDPQMLSMFCYEKLPHWVRLPYEQISPNRCYQSTRFIPTWSPLPMGEDWGEGEILV